MNKIEKIFCKWEDTKKKNKKLNKLFPKNILWNIK